jgi:Na+-transporting NADH:ubiquinone oxidoreductase subunit F
MTPGIRKLHKWVGLIIALQFVMWTGSGLTMSLLDHERVEGHHHQASHRHDPPAWPKGTLAPAQILAAAKTPVQMIEATWLGEQPVYRLTNKAAVWLVDAKNGALARVDAAAANAIAASDYQGKGRAGRPEWLSKANLEARGHQGAMWRVPFNDEDGTTLYVSAQDGRILERRNDTWRIFDFVWMLHIMDYTGRENFNNPLVIMAASGGLWIALSGAWLLITSLRLSEFVPARWRAAHELTVFEPGGTKLRSLEAHAGDTVFVAMARNGLQLPSNCGGGQNCGLCEVRIRGAAPPPSSADRDHIQSSRLQIGHRLACNLGVNHDMQIEVAGGAGLWTERVACVEKVTAITPFLREIVLTPEIPPGPDFRPGSYLQVHVPSYTLQRHALTPPAHHRDDWASLDLPETLANKEAVRRSYSLALPIEQADGRLTLLARFSPGRPNKKRLPTGKGSTYLYSLTPGDVVRFSGPFGDFAVKPGQREKIFIGGGAGMAPLRAMIHACLDRGALERMHFWYGARNVREAPYIDEMRALAELNSNFTWHLVLSEEAEHGAGLLKGLVHEATHEHLLVGHPDLHACEFYLCGPPAMLAATRTLLNRLGISEENIAFDDFKI